jgi:hypothetical protein
VWAIPEQGVTVIRRGFVIVTALAAVAVPGVARANHSIAVTTDHKARLLSPTQLRVTGTLTCTGQAEDGSIGVVVLPVGGVTLSGGGSTRFSCDAGETLQWTALVEANSFSTFSKGRIAYDTFAHTSCSDSESDCPSGGDQGVLKAKRAPAHGSIGGARPSRDVR